MNRIDTRLAPILIDTLNMALQEQGKATTPNEMRAYGDIIEYCLWWYRQHAMVVKRKLDHYQIAVQEDKHVL